MFHVEGGKYALLLGQYDVGGLSRVSAPSRAIERKFLRRIKNESVLLTRIYVATGYSYK